MNRSRTHLPFILPLMAGLFIVIWGGGLGVSFIFLNKTALGEWAVIILGLVVLVGVPTVAALLTMPKR